MLYISLIILYVAAIFISLILFHYFQLFRSKEQYTKEELKNVIPSIPRYWDSLLQRYSISGFVFSLLAATIPGLLIPFISLGWFFQSAIIFILLFIILPYVRGYMENIRVTAPADYGDVISNIFIRYTDVILYGFGAGTLSSITYLWTTHRELSFLWYIINAAVILIIMIKLLINVSSIKDEKNNF